MAEHSWNDEDARAFTELMLGRTRQYGVALLDARGAITGWSAGAAAITGHPTEEIIGEPFALLFTAADRERRLDEHELNTAARVGFAEDERWHVRKDGSVFWSAGVTMALRWSDGVCISFAKVFRDATHLRLRTEHLLNTLQRHHDEQAGQASFLALTAHELRNPLSPLKTVLNVLSAMPEASSRYDSLLKVFERQLGFLERLIEDLVDQTRLTTGKLGIVYQTVVLQDVLSEALDACRARAQSHGIALHAVLPTVPLRIDVDPQRLQQVVLNLLHNAIKFTPTGGDVWLVCTADATHFEIHVKDNGHGIAPELQPRIFDIFTQARDARSGRGDGFGVGLSLVKELVSLHHGTIEVRSEGEGKGSDFSLRVPLRRPADVAAAPDRSAAD